MAFLLARRRDLLLALAITGVAVAGYLSWVALDGEQEAVCSGVGDCKTVQGSEFSEIAGVPIAVLGLGMYLALLALIAARRWWSGLRGGEAPQALAGLTFALALGGTLYSAYLTWLELFEIEAICVWCVGSAVIVTLLMLLALPDVRAASADAAGDAGPS